MAKWSASQKRYFADFHFNMFEEVSGDDKAVGFDLGKTQTGYGVIDISDGSLVSSGIIETGRKEDGSDYKRFGKINRSIYSIFSRYNPVLIGYESVRVKTQLSSFKALAMCLACLNLARDTYERKTNCKPYFLSFNPKHVKTIATSDSSADKSGVVSSIEKYYGEGGLKEDEADALSCSKLCWYFANIQRAYQSAKNLFVSDMLDADDAYQFLLDLFKRRNDVFETRLSTFDDSGIDAVLGSLSGPAGLNNILKNSVSTYYEAMDTVNELYGD